MIGLFNFKYEWSQGSQFKNSGRFHNDYVDSWWVYKCNLFHTLTGPNDFRMYTSCFHAQNILLYTCKISWGPLILLKERQFIRSKLQQLSWDIFLSSTNLASNWKLVFYILYILQWLVPYRFIQFKRILYRDFGVTC